jgi:hypothetical protein
VCHGSLSTFYPDAKLGLTLSDVKVTNASRLMRFFIHELNYQSNKAIRIFFLQSHLRDNVDFDYTKVGI